MITLTTSPNNPNAKPQVQTQKEMRPSGKLKTKELHQEELMRGI